MKVKQKLITMLVAGGIIALGAVTLAVQPAAADCAGVKTSIINCEQKAKAERIEDTGVWGLLLLVLNIMTAGVGIAAVGGIVYAAILYASSSQSAEQTKQAKEIVRNVVIGLVAYALMYLGLNFLIPGGVFT